jgi:tetratricopeptide (TPR) repeat protein
MVLLLAIGGAGRAQAGEPPNSPKQQAKARFISGESHYNLNEFAEALREFKEGYRVFPDPVFLFNLGQCERQLDHPEEAIKFYRSFLREQPKAANRQDVLRKIEEMEAALKTKEGKVDKASASLQPAAVASPNPPVPAAAPALAPPAGVATEPTVTPDTAEQKNAAPPAPNPVPTAGTLPATPSVSPEAVENSQTGIDLSSPSAPEPQAEAGPTPLYKRWWLWTAAAAVVAGAGVGIYAATSGGGPGVPASELGSKKVF